MDDFNTVYALLVLVMLFILLSRLDNRFGKIEKELNEIKKRMEDYLKVQQNSVAEASKPKEEISEKETYTDYKYKDTNLPEKILTDEFFIVHLFLLFRNSVYVYSVCGI